jgi:hypothetical protein
MMRPNNRVRPRSAFRAAIATSGPGCGGTRPCRTDRPASAGMPILISGTSLRRETSSTIGTSRTTPTSKNSGMPMSAATPAMAQGRPRPDTRSTTVPTIRSAPPESASSPPIMAPRAMSSPTLPTVVPTPVVKLVIVLSGASPATLPSTAEPRIRARNGCTLSQVISRTTVAMPSSAASVSWVCPAAVAGAASSNVTSRLAPRRRGAPAAAAPPPRRRCPGRSA